MKKMTMIKYCDTLRSMIVRAVGRCQLAGLDGRTCSGPLQDMHIVGRTTWELRHDFKHNAICGCQGHHAFYTYGPQHAWIQFVSIHFPSKAKFCFSYHAPTRLKADYTAKALEMEGHIIYLAGEGLIKHFYSSADAKLMIRILKGESLCLQ